MYTSVGFHVIPFPLQIYAVTAVLLLIGLIVFGIQLQKEQEYLDIENKVVDEANKLLPDNMKKSKGYLPNEHIASAVSSRLPFICEGIKAGKMIATYHLCPLFGLGQQVFCGLAMLVAIVGTIAPFVCNK